MGDAEPWPMDGRVWATANLMRWLRRQLRQPTPEREHLEAAVEAGDPGEVRRILSRAPFTADQRRYVDDLLARWERALASDEDGAPG